jgi:serine/threonine protein phosphatase 1
MYAGLTYAIGDIHGSSMLLLIMLERIKDHADGREHRIITLGDYCDRGPDSKTVYDILMARPDIITLRGNHEEMFLAASDGRFGEVNHFMSNGGDATCKSFGVKGPHQVPQKYLDWIENNTRYWFEDELRVYVHAGVNWNIPEMEKQNRLHLTWMREPFLSHTEPMFKYIVHGHTHTHPRKLMAQAEVLENRCNLDTGAYYTGIMTCAVFDSTQAKPIDLLQIQDS